MAGRQSDPRTCARPRARRDQITPLLGSTAASLKLSPGLPIARKRSWRSTPAPATPCLELDDEPVVGALLCHVFEIGQHLRTQMREDEALRPDLRPVPDKVGIVEVEAHRL